MRGPEKLRLTIPGQPAGAGSKSPMPLGRMIGGRFHAVFDEKGRPRFYVKPASEKTKPWMEKVEAEARYAWRDGRAQSPPLDGPLWIEVDCYEKRPAGHLYADGRLKPTAPAHPEVTVTHDSGKLRRAIEDALTNAKIWTDDKRVVDAADRKHYCDAEHPDPCAVIRVGRMAHAFAAEAGMISPPPAGQAALI